MTMGWAAAGVREARGGPRGRRCLRHPVGAVDRGELIAWRSFTRTLPVPAAAALTSQFAGAGSEREERASSGVRGGLG